MKSTFNVRFRPSKNLIVLSESLGTPASDSNAWDSKGKSKNGCRNCRRSRVKCDETYPVCIRCRRRGTRCLFEPREQKWQLEMPGITIPRAPSILSTLGTQVDRRLLQQWVERTSQIMVLDPERNPLSYPILQLLGPSPWLAPVLQSISAAYENDFDKTKLTVSLMQRQQALSSFRQGLMSGNQPLASVLLGIFLLGVSTAWIDGDKSYFGKEHLQGGRAVLDQILEQGSKDRHPLRNFAIGTYIYWDMSCSLLVDPAEQRPLNSPAIYAAVNDMREAYHPMSGFAIELLHLLAIVGRHCRMVIETGQNDKALEATLEEQLLEWRSSPENVELQMLSEAFRMHGLILLYRICGVPDGRLSETSCPEEFDAMINMYALEAVGALMNTPIESTNFHLQPIPLLTVGSELSESDVDERMEVMSRLRALYSINRTPVTLWSIELLQEHWELRKQGLRESWVELMLRKGWRISLG